MRQTRFITAALILVLLASILSACVAKVEEPIKTAGVAEMPVASYVAVAPKAMHVGESAAVTFTLLGKKGQLASDRVEVALPAFAFRAQW